MTLGRFAPSPTGILHLGNLRTALASWLSVRAAGGRWLVRMEDVDGPRCRRDLGEAQLRDLAALGLESDGPVIWQSGRAADYQAALEALHAAGRLYPCACTRKDLQLLASAPHAEDGLRPYPGYCRDRAGKVSKKRSASGCLRGPWPGRIACSGPSQTIPPPLRAIRSCSAGTAASPTIWRWSLMMVPRASPKWSVGPICAP